MYRIHKKTEARTGKTPLPKDCFVEKTRNWLWIIAIITVAATAYAVVTAPAREPVYSSAGRLFSQGGQFRNAALRRCPYCPGLVDAQGRCNVRECPAYSPNRGKPLSRQGIPIKQTLIKELALEVGASEGKKSVVIHSIYVGGNAEKAGLKVGDKIVRFNGRKIKNGRHFRSIVARAKPESNVTIQVSRNGKKIKSSVRVGEGEMEAISLPKTRG